VSFVGKGVPVPLYYQIKTRLREAIEAGELRPGDRVPSERELTQRFQVSRMTARQALTELEAEGYLQRIQGKGTFVALPKVEQPLASLTSFTEEMRRLGMQPGAQVRSVREVAAGRMVGALLGIPETEPVVRLERLRLADGQPMALEVSHIPSRLVPGLVNRDLSAVSLYEVLERVYHIRLVRASQSLEAVAAGAQEAEVLQVREGAPLLLLERVARDETGQAVEYVRSLYRGDRYRFVADLVRPRLTGGDGTSQP